MRITTDASPWGLGAVLEMDNVIVAWIADTFSSSDKAVLSLASTPTCDDQQVVEALAALVALREWCAHWKDARVTLEVRSDNMATLSMITKMQPHGPRMGVIAREMALDISKSAYSPDVAEHLPGVANTACDCLSRLADPSNKYSVPEFLLPSQRHKCAIRTHKWYLTLPASP